jgi:hypothetical protein
MVRANQKAECLSTNFTAYKATRSLEKSVTVQDVGKVFSWLNTRTDTRVVNVDLQNLYIRNIQNQKGNKEKKV